MTTQPTLFISGAGGKLGRLVVASLLEKGYAGKIIAGTRKPEELAFPGVESARPTSLTPRGSPLRSPVSTACC